MYASASAPITSGKTSIAEASANDGQPLRKLAEAQNKQAVAYGTALPDKSSLHTLLAPNKTVSSSITPDITVLGYGVLGGAASGKDSMTVTSSLAYSVDIGVISNPQRPVCGVA